jgi:hypothetical protein
MLLHTLIGGDGDGVRASYYVRTGYISTRRYSLEEITSNDLLPNVIHELIIKLEDGRRSIEVLFSRKGVVSRIMGGVFDEQWEAEAQKAVSAFLAENRARFLVPLLSPVVFILCGAFYMMYAMASGLRGVSSRELFFYAAYITVSFICAVLFFMHRRGVYFPHAKIAIRDTADSGDSGNKILLINWLSLIIQLISLIANHFFHSARLTEKPQQLPTYPTAT